MCIPCVTVPPLVHSPTDSLLYRLHIQLLAVPALHTHTCFKVPEIWVNPLPLYTQRGHSHLGFVGCTVYGMYRILYLSAYSQDA